MQAPELKLGEENFMKIPDIEKSDDWGRRRTVQQEKDPPPEKYSIEWYEQQAELSRKRALQPEAEQPLLPLRELPGSNAPAARAVSCPAKASRTTGQGAGGLASVPSFAARRRGQVCDGWTEWGGKG